MNKKLKFVWIDDNPKERKPESVNMKERLGVGINFIDVKKKNVNTELVALLKIDQPDLILIDHKFEMSEESGIFKTGSTIAALIRDTWPSCPIICVTGVDLDEVDSQKRALYDEVFQFHDISQHDDRILSIAKSFRKIRESHPKEIGNIWELLKAPESEYQKLTTILPTQLKDFGDSGIPTNLARWVRGTLIKRPGFLYDSAWLCTLIGIKQKSFHKVENVFAAAKYNGIFNEDTNPRWWKSKVLEILSKKVKDKGLSFEKGRMLPGIEKKDFSQCHVNPKEIPETVAYEDDSPNSKKYPMSLRNTIPHPSFPDMLFFEEIRKMKPLE